MSSGRSPISSRNSVPPSASSKRPWRRPTAPVNAPFSCPKSSLSIRLGGSAAQFTRTSARDRRRLRSCTARAKSSLPVPVSPSSRYRAVERRDLCEPLQRFTHHRALADDLVEIVDGLDLLFEADVVSGQPMVELLDLGHARTKRRVLPAPLQRAADDAGQEPHSILCKRRPLAHRAGGCRPPVPRRVARRW